MKENRPWMVAVKKHVKLALIYVEDGAVATGAKLLRESADLLDAEQQRRQDILSGSTSGE